MKRARGLGRPSQSYGPFDHRTRLKLKEMRLPARHISHVVASSMSLWVWCLCVHVSMSSVFSSMPGLRVWVLFAAASPSAGHSTPEKRAELQKTDAAAPHSQT